MHIVRSLRRLPAAVACTLALLLPLAAAAATTATDSLTPAERKQVTGYQHEMETQCRKGLAPAIAREQGRDVPALTRWIDQVFLEGDYCGCASARFVSEVTPRLMRTATPAEVTAFGMRVGAECMLPRLKASFPQFCQSLLEDAGVKYGLSADSQAQLRSDTPATCACVTSDLEKLGVDTLKTYMENTTRDNQAYRANGTLPGPGSASLLASFQRCGVFDLRARIARQAREVAPSNDAGATTPDAADPPASPASAP